MDRQLYGMRPTVKEVMERLALDGFVDQNALDTLSPPRGLATADEPHPWYAQVLAGLGAWLAAVLLTFAIGETFNFGPVGSLATGAPMVALGTLLLRRQKGGGSAFVEQFALALGLSGQALMLVGLWDQLDSFQAVTAVMAGVNLLIMLVVGNPKQAFICTLLAAYFITAAIAGENRELYRLSLTFVAGISAAMLFLLMVRTDLGCRGGKLSAQAHALALALLTFAASSTPMFGLARYLSFAGITIAVAAVLGLTVHTISRQLGKDAHIATRLLLIIAVAALAYLTRGSPGILTAVLLLTLGNYRKNRIFTGLGLFALPVFLGFFYFDLEATLLAKAGILTGSGLTLLALGVALKFTSREGRAET